MLQWFASREIPCKHHPGNTKPIIPKGHHFCPICRRHRYLGLKPYELIGALGGMILGSSVFTLLGYEIGKPIEENLTATNYVAVIYPTETSLVTATDYQSRTGISSYTSTYTPFPSSTYTPFPTLTSTLTPTLTAMMPPKPTVTRTAFPSPTQRPTRTPPRLTSTSQGRSQTYSGFLTGTINTARVNVRYDPNPSSFIVYRLSEGETIRLIARNSNSTWLQVDVGVIGWVNADLVTSREDVSELHTSPSGSVRPQSQVRMNFSCPGAYGPHFSIGDRYTVPTGDGPTSIWTEPNGPPRVTRIAEKSGGTILGGPICTGGQEGSMVWWYVRTDSGQQGYVSEGYPHSPVPWIAP